MIAIELAGYGPYSKSMSSRCMGFRLVTSPIKYTPLKRFKTSLGRPYTSKELYTGRDITKKLYMDQKHIKQLFWFRTVALIKRTSLKRFTAIWCSCQNVHLYAG